MDSVSVEQAGKVLPGLMSSAPPAWLLLPAAIDAAAQQRYGAMLRLARTAAGPDVSEKALVGLKFSDALPKRLAMATLAARIADLDSAAAVLQEPVQFASTLRR